ncbi:MAG: DNA polymerase III subunit delta [Gammaproteobacteria bacterium]|nr:DNA polymerase III subunit delta [Gammaproteobacteria bacterium]
MRIAVEELANRLSRQGIDRLPGIILINGNEPLIMEEALDEVRETLKSLGFAERIKYQLDAGFDWSVITGVGQAMSLFSERRLVELRVPKSLGAAGSKALIEYCNAPAGDDLLVVLTPALDYRQRQAKWAKLVENSGWIADCAEIGAEQFPRWLRQRLQSRALRVENGVIDLLAEQLEGNVLAAAQEVDKLQVLAENGAVTMNLVSEALADQARFDVYALTNVCLEGDFVRACRIKQRLQSEGIEPVIVVWALVREIRLLANLSAGIDAGESRATIFKRYRIWSKRESAIGAALNRCNTERWYRLLEQAAHLDQTIKGQRYLEVGAHWYQIELLCSAICGVDIVTMAATA